jgi:HAD superfamily hydrolase (TIGR01509 family)
MERPIALSGGADFFGLRSASTASIQGGMCGAERKENEKSGPHDKAPYHTLLALDFDQTLALTYPHIVPVWDDFMVKWLVEHGHCATRAEARSQIPHIVNPYGCGPTTMAKHFGTNKAWIEAFYLASAPLLVEACTKGGLSIPPDLKPTLRALDKKGFYLCIISQGHRDSILPLLKLIGLAELFSPIQVIDRAHKRLEPHGYQIAKYMARNHPIQRFVMCDDSPANFPHAKTEGFETVLILPNPTAEERASANSHAPDLLTFLKTL